MISALFLLQPSEIRAYDGGWAHFSSYNLSYVEKAVTMKTIAVVGSRNFTDYELLQSVLDQEKPSGIVSGGAMGADTLAKMYAQKKGIGLREFLPDYKRYGRGATFVRNRLIVDAADKVIAFWDGKSKGTLFTMRYAEKKGREVRLVEYSKVSHPV